MSDWATERAEDWLGRWNPRFRLYRSQDPTFRQAEIDRLAIALRDARNDAPLPEDVAEMLQRTKRAVSEAVQEHGAFSVQFVTELYKALESQSRERAVLAEGFKAAVRMSDSVQEEVFGECRPAWTDIANASSVITYAAQDKADTDAIRKALALIEGEKGEG